ncbi:MAG: [Fe-Fe] hydrogenase large subunit C-terminal domain-containing protein [Patescibacteria group bacterium]|nr:[Fe-Fe] hydrogenase large subunit C-terminal domain-containing protein [Patescibacteria group bacterium]
MNPHQIKLLELLKSNDKIVAMLAPSFAIDFPHPQIVGMLKKLGFEMVTELTFGARMVNYWYVEYIKQNPDQKMYIASPCPIVVSMIENKYPELKQYLIPYASPMYAMSKIVKKKYPDYKIVFISPCQAKRLLEAPKYPEFIDLVVTFKELKEVLDIQNIKAEDFTEPEYPFDSFVTEINKIYPISGGLAQTARIKSLFKPEEICITEGVENNIKILDELAAGNSPYRFIDILNCPGGCIGGPDIINQDLDIEEKKNRILAYRDKSIADQKDAVEGKKEFVLDIDFKAKL